MRSVSRSPRRGTMVLALVAALMLVSGIFITRFVGLSASSESHPPKNTSTASASRPEVVDGRSGPPLDRAGLDAGFARDESGAIAAAVSYATAAQQWLYFTDDEIRAAVDEIATPVAAPRMAEEVVLDVSMAREQLSQSSGRIWWLVRPLAYRVEDHDEDQARVSVWVVTILSAAEVAAPQSEFMTVTLDLAWVDGGWRVDGVREAPGPTPITGPHDQPWDAEPFDRSLDGFVRLDGELVR